MQRWKYLLAYMAPLSAIVGLYYRGWFSFGSMYIGFVFIPLIEGLFYQNPASCMNPSNEPNKSHVHDWFLYLNIPLVYFILVYYFYIVNTYQMNYAEHIAQLLNVSLILGTSGINVAHELGHRKAKYHQFTCKIFIYFNYILIK